MQSKFIVPTNYISNIAVLKPYIMSELIHCRLSPLKTATISLSPHNLNTRRVRTFVC